MRDRKKYMRSYMRKHRATMPQEQKRALAATAEKRRKEKADWLRELRKEQVCLNCPEHRWQCLDWHHKNPTEKKFEINSGNIGGRNKKTILAEIKKCIVLCANCHRIEHMPL